MKTALFFLCIFIFSCKKEDFSTLGVIPESEALGLLFTDTATTIAFSQPDDSIRSDETLLNLLGTYNDPVFGKAEASIYTQVLLSTENVNFGDTSALTVDSVILALPYIGLYGNSYPQNFKVYEVTEKMHSDSSSFSNSTFQINTTEIGGITGVIADIDDSAVVGGVSEPPQLRIPLDNSLGDKLIELGNNQTNSIFTDFFKGIYIKPSPAAPVPQGEGAILYFNMFSAYSRLIVYYRNIADSDTFKYEFTFGGARVGNFSFDHSGTSIFNSDTSFGTDLIFIQSMAGSRAKIKVPFLRDFVKKGKVAVNKAELIFSIADNTTGTFSPHSNLFLTGIDSSGKPVFLIDQLEGDAHYGGTYNSSSNQYIFNITRHVQSLLSDFYEGKNNDFGLYLMGGGKAINANRTILKGNKNAGAPLKLKISYTPL